MIKNYDDYDKEEEKNILEFIRTVLSKLNGQERISISSEEIEKYLFTLDEKGYKKINEEIWGFLCMIKADMEGVGFEGTKITGLYFDGLENVRIDLNKLYDKDLSFVSFLGVNLEGDLEGAKLMVTDFIGYKGSVKLNPQKLGYKSLENCTLTGLVVEGSFDGVNIIGTDFGDIKGEAYINPQTIYEKTFDDVNLNGVTLVGEYYPEKGMYGSANFDGCKINDTMFNGAKGYICINLNTICQKNELNSKLSGCDLTGVKVVGTANCYTGRRDIIDSDGTCQYFSNNENLKNDLTGSYYYNGAGEQVLIYPYRSVVKRNGEWVAISRKEEDNLDINVVYINEKRKEKGGKKRVLNLFEK